MNVREAAQIIGISRPRVYQLIREEKLKATDIGGTRKHARWEIYPEDLQEFIEARTAMQEAMNSVLEKYSTNQ